MRHRVRVAAGFLVVAALVGIGVYPIRKGMSVRVGGQPARRPKRRAPARRRGRRRLGRALLFWW